MATVSGIEWTERSWNPIVGCLKISQGCKNCYAEVMSRRLRAMGIAEYQQSFTTVRELPHRLNEPLRIKKPSLWFVNSMSDLFQSDASDAFIARVFDTMARAHWHNFQVLTKRAERMSRYFNNHPSPTRNVWLGVSVENRKQGLSRLADLRSTPAQTRFLSVEPLLEDLGVLNLAGIHWVIVGGESGQRARPMKLEWVTSIQLQCKAAGIPFFFKQWGTFGPDGKRRSKKLNGRLLMGRTWNDLPRVIPQLQI